jgi:uncharacterized protein
VARSCPERVPCPEPALQRTAGSSAGTYDGVDIRFDFSTIQPHLSNIRVNVGGVDFIVTLDSSPLTEKLLRLLPYETMGETWGKEVYFPVNLHVENPAPVSEVKVGDIAYWPDGPDICLFFGSTPKSTGDAPVVASPVTVIGTFQFAPEDFDRIERRRNGILVNVEPAQ